MTQFIIINGTLCDASLWQELERDLRSLGHRDFWYPDITDGRSIGAYAQNIGRKLNPNTANWVIGYSLGGIIAAELTLAFPNRVEGLILVCTNCYEQTPEKEAAVKQQLEWLDNRDDGLEAILDNILLPAYFCSNSDKSGANKERVRNMGLRLGASVLRNQLQTVRSRRDQSALLPRIRNKVLLVCGGDDMLCTVAQNRGMAALLPQSTLKIIENTGHMLPLLQPEPLSVAVRTFLTEVL